MCRRMSEVTSVSKRGAASSLKERQVWSFGASIKAASIALSTRRSGDAFKEVFTCSMLRTRSSSAEVPVEDGSRSGAAEDDQHQARHASVLTRSAPPSASPSGGSREFPERQPGDVAQSRSRPVHVRSPLMVQQLILTSILTGQVTAPDPVML